MSRTLVWSIHSVFVHGPLNELSIFWSNRATYVYGILNLKSVYFLSNHHVYGYPWKLALKGVKCLNRILVWAIHLLSVRTHEIVSNPLFEMHQSIGIEWSYEIFNCYRFVENNSSFKAMGECSDMFELNIAMNYLFVLCS